MREFILKISKSNRNALGAVRCMQGLMLAEDELCIWLRGTETNMEMENQLQALPVQQRFELDNNGNMFLQQAATPVETLPELSWQKPEIFLPVELPASVMPGRVDSTISIRIVPTENIRESTGLLTTLEWWKKYAETAPAVRLARNRFAVSAKNEVMIVGKPLPSLPGKEYWSVNNIFLPAGYDFEIPLVAGFLRARLNVAKDDIILFDEAGNWQCIGKTFFVEAKRSAVRLTTIKSY
jgi:hypothetical protein